MRYRSETTKEPTDFIYIMSNIERTTLYIGVTRNLRTRVEEHRKHIHPNSFTTRYNCLHLVYYEYFDFLSEAVAREKQLKNWKRAWKEDLIKKKNPKMIDLYENLVKGTLGTDDLYF